MMNHPLMSLIKRNQTAVTSICSANRYVIESAISRAKLNDDYVVIEATANQVNQFGGYTGMVPKDFVEYVSGIAEDLGFPMSRVILGGDHLGPLTWSGEKAETAMAHAKVLIREFVLAGFTKIHIDTSMKLADDAPNQPLAGEMIANRGAELCAQAEKAFDDLLANQPNAMHPVYIIGSEVPIPGGAQEEETIQVTKPQDFRATVETFKDAFLRLGLKAAWERVIAVVVQPGVEFGDAQIFEYNRNNTSGIGGVFKRV